MSFEQHFLRGGNESFLIGLGPALGVGLLSFRPPGLNYRANECILRIVGKYGASGFPVGDPNILWVIVLKGMMPPTEDTIPARRSESRSPFGSVRGCETHKPSA